MDNPEEQRIISLCTGYGGLELGIKRSGANVRTIAYSEIEAYAVANLVSKIESGLMDAAPIWANLKTFPAECFRGKVHGIIGGYPCQPFSVAGSRRGTEDPRHLWPYIAEHIRTIRPIWCFFENVEGHLTLGFREVKHQLEELGYEVEAEIFSAVEVGAPHQRKRLFILAHATSVRHRRWSDLDGVNRNGIPELQTKKRPMVRGKAERCGGDEELPNSDDSIQGEKQGNPTEMCGFQEAKCESEHSSVIPRRSGFEFDDSCWPASPGRDQHEWEEPRTVKSGVGLSTYGITSLVDELRLCGNGVVPATAEKAWITLWNKINKNLGEN